jgi:PIN domain nuclease of toxin-antitoxin system
MRLLLDTHALVWSLNVPTRLSATAAALVRDRSNTLLVSSVSAWEIATKHRLGMLTGVEPLLAGYAAHLATLGAEELPVRSDHALRAATFGVEHRDPFDRMLAAQAVIEGVPLLTNDPAFRFFADLQTLW